MFEFLGRMDHSCDSMLLLDHQIIDEKLPFPFFKRRCRLAIHDDILRKQKCRQQHCTAQADERAFSGEGTFHGIDIGSGCLLLAAPSFAKMEAVGVLELKIVVAVVEARRIHAQSVELGPARQQTTTGGGIFSWSGDFLHHNIPVS
ncbi:MAG: hypothetical protein V4599_07265 [Verrucomicrobiota bacterium]